MSHDDEPDECLSREATPLVSIQLQNWPPAGLTPKASTKLIAMLAKDFERMLASMLPSRRSGSASQARKAVDADVVAGDADASGPGEGVDCKMTGWGYEIVEIDGVPTRCRVEYYVCTDGTSYRLEYPL